MKNSIRVIVADDHTLVRAGICSLVEKMTGVEVVAQASNGREALRMVSEIDSDLVVMDIAMPELNGLETTRLLLNDFPQLKVIILSMHTSEEYVLSSLQFGASGFVVKEAVPSELEIAIRSVMQGQNYLSPAISKVVINKYRNRTVDNDSGKPDSIQNALGFVLTSRQREILQLIAEGNSTREIADKLSLSIKTVNNHRMQIMDRLDIHEVTGLVRYAIRRGIVTADK